MPNSDGVKTYEDCLNEIQTLYASGQYGKWGRETRKNSGVELTRQDFQMDDDFLDGYACRFDQLFNA